MLSLSVNRLIAIAVVALCVLTMISLGLWQLDRMQQKKTRLASIAQKQQKETLDIESALSLSDPRDLAVEFSGLPDTSRILLLDNQIHDGQTGYDVIVPVNTNAGWILVNYGWIKAPQYRDQVPQITLPDDKAMFSGMVVLPSLNPMVSETATGNEAFPMVIQQLDISKIERWLGTRLARYSVTLTSYDKNFIRNWMPVVMPPEKHLGYAIQWFALALAAAVIGGMAILRRSKHDR